MEKLGEVPLPEPLPLLMKLQPDRYHSSWPYISQALFCLPNCYLVSINQPTCKNLLINASFQNQNHSMPHSEFPTLEEIIMHFKSQIETFFNNDAAYANLYGPTVKKYYDTFAYTDKPMPCILRDSYFGMREDKPLYVIDGMHRLVAFGLHTDFASEYFPVEIYYCTQKLLT